MRVQTIGAYFPRPDVITLRGRRGIAGPEDFTDNVCVASTNGTCTTYVPGRHGSLTVWERIANLINPTLGVPYSVATDAITEEPVVIPTGGEQFWRLDRPRTYLALGLLGLTSWLAWQRWGRRR